MEDRTQAQVGKQDVVVTRVIDAPVEKVWQAWVDPELVQRWWGPDGFIAPLARIDFREGGTSLVSMSSPQLGFPESFSTWEYTRIIPHKSIEYVHNLADQNGRPIDPASAGMPPDFLQPAMNRVDFKDLGDGRTELTVTEFDWPLGQMREMSRMGLEQCINKMAAIFTQ